MCLQIIRQDTSRLMLPQPRIVRPNFKILLSNSEMVPQNLRLCYQISESPINSKITNIERQNCRIMLPNPERASKSKIDIPNSKILPPYPITKIHLEL